MTETSRTLASISVCAYSTVTNSRRDHSGNFFTQLAFSNERTYSCLALYISNENLGSKRWGVDHDGVHPSRRVSRVEGPVRLFREVSDPFKVFP